MKISHIMALLAVSSASAFSVGSSPETSRRSWLSGGVAALVAGVPCAASAALGKGTPVGREIDTFTSLIYNFKNTDLNGGLDASTLKEPSVPFIEFGEKMLKKEVEFVEFMAPSGDIAYVTFKAGKGQKKKEPIRIGQGYPINKKGSWSSPDYVIRVRSLFIVLKEGIVLSNNSHTLAATVGQQLWCPIQVYSPCACQVQAVTTRRLVNSKGLTFLVRTECLNYVAEWICILYERLLWRRNNIGRLIGRETIQYISEQATEKRILVLALLIVQITESIHILMFVGCQIHQHELRVVNAHSSRRKNKQTDIQASPKETPSHFWLTV
jgi:hypothetical protein